MNTSVEKKSTQIASDTESKLRSATNFEIQIVARIWGVHSCATRLRYIMPVIYCIGFSSVISACLSVSPVML